MGIFTNRVAGVPYGRFWAVGTLAEGGTHSGGLYQAIGDVFGILDPWLGWVGGYLAVWATYGVEKKSDKVSWLRHIRGLCSGNVLLWWIYN